MDSSPLHHAEQKFYENLLPSKLKGHTYIEPSASDRAVWQSAESAAKRGPPVDCAAKSARAPRLAWKEAVQKHNGQSYIFAAKHFFKPRRVAECRLRRKAGGAYNFPSDYAPESVPCRENCRQSPDIIMSNNFNADSVTCGSVRTLP
jgi:hypothetical protein